MTERELRIYPDPVLRKPTRPIENFDDEFRIFVKELETLMFRYDGVGLAAPQVGESLDVAVVFYGDTLYVLSNPLIIKSEGEQRGQEGCLSFPDIFEDITRPERVTVESQNENGEMRQIEAEGFLARAFCHEIDHLRGKLMIDHLSSIKREQIKKKLLKRKKRA